MSAVITLCRIFRTVGIRLFCKHERSVLFYNTSRFINQHISLADGSFHVVASIYVRFRYSGKIRSGLRFFGVFLSPSFTFPFVMFPVNINNESFPGSRLLCIMLAFFFEHYFSDAKALSIIQAP